MQLRQEVLLQRVLRELYPHYSCKAYLQLGSQQVSRSECYILEGYEGYTSVEIVSDLKIIRLKSEYSEQCGHSCCG